MEPASSGQLVPKREKRKRPGGTFAVSSPKSPRRIKSLFLPWGKVKGWRFWKARSFMLMSLPPQVWGRKVLP